MRYRLQFLSSAKWKIRAPFCGVKARALPLKLSLAIIGIISLNKLAYAQNSSSDKSDFDAAFRELKRNDSLQFDFTTAPPPPETPAWLKAIAQFFEPLFKFIGVIFSMLIPLVTIIFWVGIGAFVMAVLYLLVTTIMAANLQRGDKTDDSAAAPLYQPEQAQARILLDEIDALAAQGKYAEAVHTLLFRSIQDIDANRPNVIRRSLTSREIGGLAILTEGARDVFSNIAAIVERSFFGGQDIGKADFDMARADYARLAGQSGQWANADKYGAAS